MPIRSLRPDRNCAQPKENDKRVQHPELDQARQPSTIADKTWRTYTRQSELWPRAQLVTWLSMPFNYCSRTGAAIEQNKTKEERGTF